MQCIKCDAPLEGNTEAGAPFGKPPLSALLLYTRGVTQSSVFSPEPQRADYEHLRVGICNSCLISAGERGAVEHGTLSAPPGNPLPGEWRYRLWRLPPPSPRPLPPTEPDV